MTTLVFGDSFVGPFKLIDDKNLKVFKFKGATIKGLTKIENENRKAIINTINKTKSTNCIIFNFGQVDLYFSYYYNKFLKKKRFMMNSVIKKYIEFISSLESDNSNKIVLAVYPTTIKDENVFNSLLNYGILSESNVKLISDSEKKKLSNFRFRYNMYIKFNNLLEKYCKLHNINFINLDNLLLDDNKRLKSEFKNTNSDVSVHLLWEPLIPILLSKLLKCKIRKKYKDDLIKTLFNYNEIKKSKKR